MRLTEIEGKQLLAEAGISIPESVAVIHSQEIPKLALTFPVYLKAQVLHGNRALQGLVVKAESETELPSLASELFTKSDANNNPIETILIEQGVSFERQVYLALTYDTQTRGPVLKFSDQAGEGIEERGDSIQTLPFSISNQPPVLEHVPAELVNKIWQLFLKVDATLLEINPLVETNTGWVALDAKIELDETAAFRHPEWSQLPERSDMGRPPTQRELKAHEVSRSDHRGVAGESFFEFEGGEIGVLAAGGGASILAMDALLAEGLQPANYTEHSGNPPREKVKGVADVILSIPNLKGLFVVGTNANFTDIYETMAGVIDGLLDSQYAQTKGFALLIRRGGPRWEEAFAMIRERLQASPITYKLFGPDFPIVKTAREMKLLIQKK